MDKDKNVQIQITETTTFLDVVKSIGTYINSGNREYYYLPFWIIRDIESNKFTVDDVKFSSGRTLHEQLQPFNHKAKDITTRANKIIVHGLQNMIKSAERNDESKEIKED